MEASPLGRLAPELRNQIYELVLCPSEGSDIHIQHAPTNVTRTEYVRAAKTPSARPTNFAIIRAPSAYGLLRCCREIHDEARGFLRSNTVFRLHGLSSIFHYANVREHEVESALLAWYHHQVREHAGSQESSLYIVNIDLGTWNAKSQERGSVQHLVGHGHNFVVEVLHSLERHSIECNIEINVEYTDLLEHRIGCISFSTRDQSEPKALVEAKTKEESQRSKKAWDDGTLTIAQYGTMQMDLQQCRKYLGRFISRILKR